MLVVSCSHGRHIGKSIAKNLKAKHSNLYLDKFPDSELKVRYISNLKGKKIILVQSFFGNISDCIVEAILAASTAKELGAKKIILAAPYFPYMRQDKRFNKGEAISQRIIANLFDKYFDELYTIDPHLHRIKNLGKIFKIKAISLTANKSIAEFIKKNIKNPVVIGPDEESRQWAAKIADFIGAESRILKKTRYSSYHVEVKLNKPIELKGKNVVIVDDIVSTGHTIIEAAKLLRKFGARDIYCICVHGLFIGDALKNLEKAKIKMISTNTLPNPKSKIDISGLFMKA